MIKPIHVTLEPNEDNTDGDAATIYVLPTTTEEEVKDFFINGGPHPGFNIWFSKHEGWANIQKTRKQPFAEYVRWQASQTG
jgi:hypothetical protein